MVKFSRSSQVRVSADGEGLVSRAGVALLREVTVKTGLGTGWTEALMDTYDGMPIHLPGRVLADLAVMIADGGDALSHLATLRDQEKLFGSVASDATAWRVMDRVDTEHLTRLQTVRAAARERAWAAGAGPDITAGLVIDIDATITIAHSEKKENAAKTWKKSFGFHPLLAYLDRPDVSGGESLAGMLRPGNAGSNTAADHIEVLKMALAALPAYARPIPGDPNSPRVQIRTDSAGATHTFAAALRTTGCGFSLGFPIGPDTQNAALTVPDNAWSPAYNIDGNPRDGGWVTEITGMLDLTKWPEQSRVFLRRERPHPGAQLRFTDADGHRFTAFITDTTGGQPADLEVHHRSHARVEDRIRCGKNTGLRNFPCRGYAENKVWLELSLTAADLLTWAQALCFTDDLAHCEPATFRYRICAIAAKIARTARVETLHLDRDWPWAQQLANAFTQLRAAPWPG